MSNSLLQDVITHALLPDSRHMQRVMRSLVIGVMCAMLSALLLAGLVGMGLYSIYDTLVTMGLTRTASLLVVAGFITCLLMISILLTGISISRATDTVQPRASSELLSHLEDAVVSFVEGFMSETPEVPQAPKETPRDVILTLHEKKE